MLQSYHEKLNLIKLLGNFSGFIRRTMEFWNISTLLHWSNAWHWQDLGFFPHRIILEYIFRLPLRLYSQGIEEVWLTESIPKWAFTYWLLSGGTGQNLIPQGKLFAPTKPWKNCGNTALTVPGHLAALLLSRSSSVAGKSLNPSSAHRGKQTQKLQPKDWQLWFMLKCFLLGQIVSTETNAGGLFRQKRLFFPFFLFPLPTCNMSFLWWAQLVLSVLVHQACWRRISNLKIPINKYPKEGLLPTLLFVESRNIMKVKNSGFLKRYCAEYRARITQRKVGRRSLVQSF